MAPCPYIVVKKNIKKFLISVNLPIFLFLYSVGDYTLTCTEQFLVLPYGFLVVFFLVIRNCWSGFYLKISVLLEDLIIGRQNI